MNDFENIVEHVFARYIWALRKYSKELENLLRFELESLCFAPHQRTPWNPAARVSFAAMSSAAGSSNRGLSQSPEQSAACFGTDSESICKAMEKIASYARQTLVDCAEQASIRNNMLKTHELLEEPLENSKIAKAYDMIYTAKQCNIVPVGFKNNVKQAALIIRELLVLNRCSSLKHVDSNDFENAMADVFGRPLDSELMSQFALAFSTIIRLGKDWEEFQKAAPKIFGRHLSSDDMRLLFGVYCHCAVASPNYSSKAQVRNRSSRQGKKKPATQGPADSVANLKDGVGQRCGAQVVDSGHVEHPPEEPRFIPLPGDERAVICRKFLEE